MPRQKDSFGTDLEAPVVWLLLAGKKKKETEERKGKERQSETFTSKVVEWLKKTIWLKTTPDDSSSGT